MPGPAPVRWLDITGLLQPRPWELVARLTVRPEGIDKAAVLADLWPGVAGANTAAVAVSRARASLDTAAGAKASSIVLTDRRAGHRLNSRVVEVDLWELYAALAASRQPGTDPTTALDAIVSSATGAFAADLHNPWAERVREGLRLDVAEALGALTRAVPKPAGAHVLARLTAACAADPGNQALCRETMRAQARLGHYEDIPRTLALLAGRLAPDHRTPDRQTIDLAQRLTDRASPASSQRGEGHDCA